jgi:hypothetical protein
MQIGSCLLGVTWTSSSGAGGTLRDSEVGALVFLDTSWLTCEPIDEISPVQIPARQLREFYASPGFRGQRLRLAPPSRSRTVLGTLIPFLGPRPISGAPVYSLRAVAMSAIPQTIKRSARMKIFRS